MNILLGSMDASLGKYIHRNPERLDKLSAWFGSYGYKLFAITFFIPGVRHVTGYFADVTRVPFKNYALSIFNNLMSRDFTP